MQTTYSRRDWIANCWLLWLGLAVFLSRLFFLNSTYALDGDAWGIASAARQIAATHEYVISRPPGFPVPEIVYSFFWRGGPAVMNGVTAILSVLGSISFALVLRRFDSSRWLASLGALGFAFVPLVYINSTTSMDYVWGLSMVTAALYLVLADRPVAAGMLAGVAVGCRITNGLLVLPLAIILHGCCREDRAVRRVAVFLAVAVVAALVVYAPVYLKYGMSFLRFSDMPLSAQQRHLMWILGPTTGLWGILGCAGLIIGVASMAIAPLKTWRRLKSNGPRVGWVIGGSLMAILLIAASYVRLPHEFAYLLPVVPFTLLLLRILLTTRIFLILNILLVAAPFTANVSDAGRFTLEGPLLIHSRQRQAQFRCIREAFAAVNRLPEDRAVVAINHTYRPYIEGYPPRCRDLQFTKPVEIVDALSREQVPDLVAKGVAVYYVYAEQWYIRQGCHVARNSSGAWIVRAEDFVAPDSDRWNLTPFDLGLLEARLSPDPEAGARFQSQLRSTQFYVAGRLSGTDASGECLPIIVLYDGRPSIAAFDTPARAEALKKEGDQLMLVSGQGLLGWLNENLWLVVNPDTLHPAVFGAGKSGPPPGATSLGSE